MKYGVRVSTRIVLRFMSGVFHFVHERPIGHRRGHNLAAKPQSRSRNHVNGLWSWFEIEIFGLETRQAHREQSQRQDNNDRNHRKSFSALPTFPRPCKPLFKSSSLDTRSAQSGFLRYAGSHCAENRAKFLSGLFIESLAPSTCNVVAAPGFIPAMTAF